ncbi:hypothetical protein FJ434_22685 [Mesorhizobium sp. B2-5-13]|uniref:glucosamine inositolphosphorylceramide transferase family protein n=1 Tax=unclassified Mesorhizobium TaxID=325217 RepID=UPI00112B46D7|nr:MULTISPECIES: hypothetical protein [unclassified Mesorhizobium]TPJ38710.1 hypothetical protein FJ432_21660 [Mesorhizobium sp. B2-6-5]TPJ79734.1 hypothetical protein FJ434_22685 [Mesorhizobium sp. B2-5-13]TPK44124.1 hypothetical protein FJ560_23485 [Mesorhizobium sp. B2-5-5]
MSRIDILVPDDNVCSVHMLVAKRLAEKGHDVALVGVAAPGVQWPLGYILRLERKAVQIRGHDLLEPVEGVELSRSRPDAELRIDLTGVMLPIASPGLRPGFAGSASIAKAARVLMAGGLPDIEIILDGERIARAAPMVDSRLSILRGLNDILARMCTLLVDTTDHFLKGHKARSEPTGRAHQCPTNGQLIGTYLLSTIPRQTAGAAKRLGFRLNRWRVSYRFHNGQTVAATGLLAGEPWIDLPDDGDRFYADPFPFEWQGRYFIFIEDFCHASTKAVISVTEVFRDGAPTVPRVVIEEPYHLSYPQVFSHGGQIWMLPEGGSGGDLVLYRAESFPDRWVRHSVLIPDRELFDATLLEHGGKFWLFATERDGYGSASDTLVVYYAQALEGPWFPHRSNPVRIDRAAARPGGCFVRMGDRIILPLQNGTDNYGGGLGLADLVELDETKVRLTLPVPILASAKRPYPMIHTLNSSDHLEVIDCRAPAPRSALRRVV